MKMLRNLILATVGALALMTAPVKAASFNWLSFTQPDVIPMLAATSLDRAVENEVWNFSGQYTSPWDSEGVRKYTRVQATGSATYTGFGTVSAIEFLWGTVDEYNTVEFWFNGELKDWLTGTQALVGYGFDGGAGAGTIEILSDGVFDKMVFRSSSNAFEYANLRVTAIPLPAALPLYGAGIAVLGFIGWRKRQKSRSQAAV